MSGTPDADSGREGFTCSALLMCLYLLGLSKKKPEEATSTSRPPVEPGPDQPPEQEPPYAPSRAASLEKFECASLYSGNNTVFDFVMEGGEEEQAGARAIHGYCPSPCFELPVELIRAGKRCGVVAAASNDPVTAAFVFGDHRGGALKKMASCLASGVEGKETRPPHLVRFLSASGSSEPRPPVMPSRAAPKGAAVDGDCEFADGACVQRQDEGRRVTAV
ncbi:uncharacterized protein LOC133890026 [Phragmites australis]|uniref:uncharacterized protein LOC133890026 n=1 Tax=Phragmites australis TaxID=29695 RepID=UPI002D783418|nr:uncharacterized protein LOC133890026 [Phragmites australis]